MFLTLLRPQGSGAVDATVTPGVGSLTLTGFAPTVTAQRNITVTPGAGSLVLTGRAPTVSATQSKTVLPGTGTLTITGYAPSVTVPTSVSVTPGAGGLTITGYAPTVYDSTFVLQPIYTPPKRTFRDDPQLTDQKRRARKKRKDDDPPIEPLPPLPLRDIPKLETDALFDRLSEVLRNDPAFIEAVEADKRIRRERRQAISDAAIAEAREAAEQLAIRKQRRAEALLAEIELRLEIQDEEDWLLLAA